jgi:exonuclease SbcD
MSSHPMRTVAAMRILHTSDWHLGRTFHGASLHDDQAEAIDRIVELAAQNGVDLVVIAGDLYDRAIPPADAVALFDRALALLRDTGATVVAIGGNHDSNIRVGVYDSLLSALGMSIRGDVLRSNEPVLVAAADGGPPVAVYPLPYLDPTVVGPLLQVADETEEPEDHASESTRRRRLRHDEVTRLALDRIRVDLNTRDGARSVVVAHTFVTGGEICESERELTVGNIETVGVDAFAGFDYVALGHLHGSQERDGARVAYSGTPLPYSFSEQHHIKSIRIVDLAPDGSVTVEVVPLDIGRKLCSITGCLDDLLTDQQFAHAEPARVRVYLTDANLPMQAMARLRARFPHAAELHHRPDGLDPANAAGAGRTVIDATVSPFELTMQFWDDQHTGAPSSVESELLTAALSASTDGHDQ